MIVPRQLVEQKQIPVRKQEQCAAEAEKCTKHDSYRTLISNKNDRDSRTKNFTQLINRQTL